MQTSLEPLAFALLFSMTRAEAQVQVWDLSGAAAGDAFGSVVVTIEDLNGDGVRDLLVGAPRSDHGGANAGSVQALSGADGALLYRIDGSSANELFGSSLAALADLDGDGLADWIAGAPFASPGAPKVGRADVRSGADGALIFALSGTEQFSLAGTAVAGTGDANGDAVPDVLVSAPFEDSNGTDAGTLTIYSGVDGTFVRSHPGDAPGERFALVLADMGDVDGDGIGDYAAGSQHGAAGLGLVRAFSGATGAVLYSKLGSSTLDEFAACLATLGDLDGDGCAELLVGAPADSTGGVSAGAAFAFSGAGGGLIRTFQGGPSDSLGWSVADAGDWNGDGNTDLALAARGPSPYGEVRLHSGTDSSLLVGIAAAASQQDFGSALAGGFDIDGDGGSELAIGDERADGGAVDAGSLGVFATHNLLGLRFCFGDGSGGACPCGNFSPGAAGCANSSGEGALLEGAGSASVAADDLNLIVTNALPGKSALLFSGTLMENGGAGTILGDGLRCVGGVIQRHAVRLPDAAGGATWGPGLLALAGWSAGATREFQVWYRDSLAGPCSTGFNLSQALELVLLP
jgi:hypothetical protein